LTLRLSPHAPRFEGDITTKGVMFGIPCYGGAMVDACQHGLQDTKAALDSLGIGYNEVTIRNESLVQRARNSIVAHFLASTADRLFFIDSDIGFSADQVLRLLSHDRDVIAGLYRKKRLDQVEFAVNMLPGETAMRDPETGAVQCAAVATGFLCIKRNVIESMVQAFPHLHYHMPDGDGTPGNWRSHTYALFDCWIDPITRAYLREDYAFCSRWRAMGGEVWCDPGLILEHYGMLALSADPMDGLQVVT